MAVQPAPLSAAAQREIARMGADKFWAGVNAALAFKASAQMKPAFMRDAENAAAQREIARMGADKFWAGVNAALAYKKAGVKPPTATASAKAKPVQAQAKKCGLGCMLGGAVNKVNKVVGGAVKSTVSYVKAHPVEAGLTVLSVIPPTATVGVGLRVVALGARGISAASKATRAAEVAGGVAKADRAVEATGGASKLGQAARSCLKPHSFDGNTHVLMADGTTRKISDIKVGDKVWATNPETAHTGPRTVTALITGTGDKHLVDITVATPTGPATLTATDHHPFWDTTDHTWTDAEDLNPTDRLQTPTGAIPVTTTRTYQETHTVYNLTVDDLHTYYVLAGTTPVLVHNSGGTCEDAGRGLWQLTKEGSSKIMNGGPFRTTFYKSSSDGTWWTSDVTGHAGSAFKVYEETGTGLNWIADADEFGTYIVGKWKGGTGKFIPNSSLRGVK
ncbi:Hedgehog/intein hint domain protein [Parafrankia sp. EUN1f]|nr:Hedgehog/intein hint domain protein [Parafrankia sp. EUN1f]